MRVSYRREQIQTVFFPIGGALMEAGFIGVIADKVYAVHPAVLALITAAPMFGNLSSLFWARLAHGRPKVPFASGLLVVLVALLAGMALLPTGPLGGALLAANMVVSRLVLAGFITVRSLIWTLNYPSESRGRVTARLSLWTTLAMTVSVLAGGRLLDANPESFRWIYAVGAVFATIGVVAFSRVRVRDEHEHLALERGEVGPPPVAPEGADAPESALPEPPRPVETHGLVALLRSDPVYARYLGWQFLLGVSNMMIEAPLLVLVSRDLGAGYAVSTALTLVLPLGLSVLTLPLWAIYLDRVHIAEFRARHSWLWVASQALTWWGALEGSLLVIGVGRAVLGLARGGGQLAWVIGHNDFARPERAGLYMGVHVTLTGLRGAFAPFLGMLLYVGWAAHGALPASAGIGVHVMGLAALLSTIATLGFTALHHHLRTAHA
ncbi:MAG: MFS transporter [Myxococcota bacterium]|nr:MFS transporter [Myxococcota bacterium]